MGETSFRSPLIWSFFPLHFLCVSHFIQWETPPPFRNPFCPSPCDFPLLSPPFKRTQIVFVNGNCRQKRQAKWISWRGILLFNPSSQSLPCSIERERKKTIGLRLWVQNSLLEGITQVATQREVCLTFCPKNRGSSVHVFWFSRQGLFGL